MNAGEATPPNPPFRRGRRVGPRETPPELSAASRGGAIRLQGLHAHGVWLSAEARLYRLFLLPNETEVPAVGRRLGKPHLGFGVFRLRDSFGKYEYGGREL